MDCSNGLPLISSDPFTAAILAEIPRTEEAEMSSILKACKNAQLEWRDVSLEERAARMIPLSSRLIEKQTAIISTLVSEVGMPITEARDSTLKLKDRIDFLVNKSPTFLNSTLTKLGDNRVNLIQYDPIGLIGCIMPWNHPFTIPFWSIIPALIAGNGVIYKPSELTPLVGKEIDDLMQTLDMPKNLFQTVYGDGNLGRLISSSNEINMISFAGSIRAGRQIYAEASKNMKRLILENGGKDALIIGDYNDKNGLSDKILLGFLRHSGQLCSSVRRVYIGREECDEYLDILKNKIINYKIGDPRHDATVVGPLKTEQQVKRLDEQVKKAVEQGAKVVYGGYRQLSQMYTPTILADVTQDMDILREEVFGPVLCVIKVDHLANMANVVNNSEFGLNSSIWHDDFMEAKKLASQIEAGTVTINMLPGTHNYCTWHGIKMSGIGNILSEDGVRQFALRKNIRYAV